MVKGGLSVDVGVRAFMPASRSGAKDAAEMEKLIGQEIRAALSNSTLPMKTWWWIGAPCSKRRNAPLRERRYSEIRGKARVQGTVRSLTDYGAFVDIGGVDALLHVAEISWGRVE